MYADHSGRREPLGPTGPAIGCVIAGSRTVYFPGDTDLFPAMGELAGRLDVAMLPGLGLGPDDRRGPPEPDARRGRRGDPPAAARHPDPLGHVLPGGHAARGAGAVRRARPDFAAALAQFAPDVPARVLAPGESLDLPPSRGLRRDEPRRCRRGSRLGARSGLVSRTRRGRRSRAR